MRGRETLILFKITIERIDIEEKVGIGVFFDVFHHGQFRRIQHMETGENIMFVGQI